MSRLRSPTIMAPVMIHLPLFSSSFENNFTVCNIPNHIITVKLIGKW